MGSRGAFTSWPMGTWGNKKNIYICFFFIAIFSCDLSRFCFLAHGVPLIIGPWGLGLGLVLGLGSGLGFSIPIDWTGGPLQDALVFFIRTMFIRTSSLELLQKLRTCSEHLKP